MIDKNFIEQSVADAISGTDIFIVDIRIDADNNIVVELDSPGVLDLDTCAGISRRLNQCLEERGEDDFSLEVGSAGITSPLKVRGQYLKNVGHDVEVLTRDGRKLRGTLASVADSGNPLAFTLDVAVKVKEPGAKRPVTVIRSETFDVAADIKKVTPVIDFK